MCINYHKIDSKILQYDLDSIEFKFGMWITKKEFGQRLNLNNQLPKGQFYMSVRNVSKDINTTDKIVRRLIREFAELEIIRPILKSNNPKNGSIYEYLVQCQKGTVEDIVKTQLGHSKTKEISYVKDSNGHSRGIPKGTVEGTSKKKSKSKENNIYINIYSHWNSKKIIVHKKITDDMCRAIKKALEKYSEEEIVQAINTYDEILKSDFYFNYKWSLTDFLNRKNGVSTFMDEGSNKNNYDEYLLKNRNRKDNKNNSKKLRGWD
ncbi:hypothetical protein [Clostridium butyricum]|uniref:hypothetical protein n=1 Tax=Clostridium butyricum TaxID=1492 RepID=UPI003467C2A6